MSSDFQIGIGDNAPALVWPFPFAIAGSDFILYLQQANGSYLTLTASSGALVIDPVANTVSWPLTSAQSAALLPNTYYKLRRSITGGELRYYFSGYIRLVDGAVSILVASLPTVGPQGPPGPAGPGGGSPEQNYALSVAAAGQTVFSLSPPPVLLSSLVLTVNGVDYRAPVALQATTTTLTWSGPFSLAPSDDVHVSYF